MVSSSDQPSFGFAYQVTIVEMLDRLGLDDVDVNRNRVYSMPLMMRIRQHPQITIYTGTACTEVFDNRIRVRSSVNGAEKDIPCDMIVCAAGVHANTQEALAFQDVAPEFMMIGDCRKVARIPEAVHAAYFAALDLNI